MSRAPQPPRPGSPGWRRPFGAWRRVPFIPQLETTDCGAACAAMALARNGIHVPVRELRPMCGHGRSGANALNIAKALRHYGVDAEGVRLSVSALNQLPPGSVLHWDFNHFVVLERAADDYVEIVDPQLGRRRLSNEAVSRSFTGLALRVQPRPGPRPARGTARRQGARSEATRLVYPSIRRAGGLGGLFTVSTLLRLLFVALPLLVGVAIDRVAADDRANLGPLLLVATAVVAAYTLGFSLVRLSFIVRLRALVLEDLTGRVIDHLIHLPYPFFAARSVGDLATRLRGLGLLRDLLTASAVMLFIDAALAFIYLGALMVLDVRLALVAAAFAVAQVAAILRSHGRYANATSESIQTETASQNYLYQMLSGIETLQAAAAEEEAVAHWKGLLTEEINSASERVRIAGVVDAALTTLRVTAPLAVVAVAVAANGAGRLSAGGIVAAAALATGLSDPIASVLTVVLQLQLVVSYSSRVADILETPRDDAVTPSQAAPSGAGEVAQLSFERVTFRHPGAAEDTITDLSFDVRRGEFVALVGPSGAGKSTVLHLALGMFLPTSGTVAWEGRSTDGLDRRNLRKRLGVVVQEPFIFGGTIRENLAFGSPDAGLADLVHAARLACIDQEVSRLPMGYDTVLAERGASLSGGQRQRIALARALVGHPEMLVLDEATSALDAITEDLVYENLRAVEVTVLVAAHRLTTIRKADRIVVLRDGRLEEIGSHRELRRQRGLYWSLTKGGRR